MGPGPRAKGKKQDNFLAKKSQNHKITSEEQLICWPDFGPQLPSALAETGVPPT
jgi:hypothetical protein